MAIRMKEVRSLSADATAALRKQGISRGEALLEAGKTAKGRRDLAAATGLDSKVILEAVNRADLARVKGIGGVYADLLEEAGVDTVKELATRRSDNLHARMVEVNNEKKLSARTPTQSMVENWVAQAKALPKLVEY